MNHGIYSFFSRLFCGILAALSFGLIAYSQESGVNSVSFSGHHTGYATDYELTYTVGWTKWGAGCVTIDWVSLGGTVDDPNVSPTWSLRRGYFAYENFDFGSYISNGDSTCPNASTGSFLGVRVHFIFGSHDEKKLLTLSNEPDPCGPVDISEMIVNPSRYQRDYGVYRGSETLELLYTFSVPAYDETFFEYHEDYECEPITVFRLNDALPEIPEAQGIPDAPDPPAPPEDPDPVPDDGGPLDFEETDLAGVVADASKSNAEQISEVLYDLSRSEDERLQAIQEILDDIKSTNDEIAAKDLDVDVDVDVDSQGTEDRLDDVVSELQEHNDREDAREARIQSLIDSTPDESAFMAAGQSAASGIVAIVPELEYAGPDITGAPPIFLLEIGSVSWNLDPFQFEGMSDLADWVRAGFAFFFVIAFGRWASETGSGYIKAIASARQAKGNTVAGTGGQATGLIAAGLITAALATATLALYSWTTYDIGIGTVADAFGWNPFSGGGVVSGAIYLLDRFIPLAAFVGLLVGQIIWRMAADTAFLLVTTIIRFIVP